MVDESIFMNCFVLGFRSCAAMLHWEPNVIKQSIKLELELGYNNRCHDKVHESEVDMWIVTAKYLEMNRWMQQLEKNVGNSWTTCRCDEDEQTTTTKQISWSRYVPYRVKKWYCRPQVSFLTAAVKALDGAPSLPDRV